MGVSRKKRETFFLAHPKCCFCGGSENATQIDHIPSRACFDDRIFPDGFEFPACDACNSGTSNEEQWVAMLSHMLSHPGEVIKPDQFGRYIKGVANNLPDLFAKTNAVRRVPGGGLIEIPFEHRPVIDIVLSKWAKAFYYMDTGQIVPCAASIITHIYTNIDADKIPYAVFTAKQHALRAGKKSLQPPVKPYSVSPSVGRSSP
jgi:hypothetical protein